MHKERKETTHEKIGERTVITIVGKFKPRLIELTYFKPKLLIRLIINKPC